MIAPAQAFFMPAADCADRAAQADQRFCVFHPGEGTELRGCVVYIHPFAEEMNKARRMAALQSRALAAAGFSVLQMDLQGCGDSTGDFGDASWQGWIDDVVRAVNWLRSRDAAHSAAPLWLWGMRSGCLLAAQAAAKLDGPCNFCFWQPSINGQTLLQQFLRLRLASGLFGGTGSEMMGELRASLEQGRSVEVAGYTVSSALAQGLEQARLSPPAKPPDGKTRLEWFELSTRPDAQASPVSLQALAQWTAAGLTVRHRIVQGPSFWQTVEIEEAPALLEQTLSAFQGLEIPA